MKQFTQQPTDQQPDQPKCKNFVKKFTNIFARLMHGLLRLGRNPMFLLAFIALLWAYKSGLLDEVPNLKEFVGMLFKATNYLYGWLLKGLRYIMSLLANMM